MKIVVSENLGSVYWKEGDEIAFAPMNRDGSFSTEEGGLVETWEEVSKEEKARIINALQ